MRDATARRLYNRELGGALALYAIALVGSLMAVRHMPEGAMRTAVLLIPVIPFALAVWAVVRQVRRSDEFVRLTTLQDIAIAAGVTAGWTFAYGFLENAGFPRLSMFTVWPVMGAVWGVLACARNVRAR